MTALDRETAFSGTVALDDPGFDVARLGRYLEGVIDGFEGPLALARFKGGQSNPTFLVETASRAYVVRRKPPGPLLPSAHAVDREFRVLSALDRAGFPVAHPYALCTDEAVIGSMFYVMDKVEGRVFWDPAMPGAAPAQRSATYDAMNATLARLHGFDPSAIGLSDYGRGEGYIARQIARWTKQYAASATEDVPEMRALADWLPGAVPPQPAIVLVHGDYRLDNLIVDPATGAVRAVLDWELSTLGDPLADVTYHLMQWIMPRSESGAGTGSLAGLDLGALGIPSLEAYARAYTARTGFDPLPRIETYFAYNLWRLAAILQGILGRARDGTAANAAALAMAAQVRPLAEEAWRFARRAGAR